MKKILIFILISIVLGLNFCWAKDFNVSDFGAIGDGVFDNTSAFQKALDAAGEAKYGTVIVDNGNYLFKGHLTVPTGVTLKGTRSSVPANNGIRDQGLPLPTEGGSTLMPTEHAGTEEGEAFITLNTNSTLLGFVIYYPNQTIDQIPTPYPWAVAMRGKNPALLDCELLNPYNGIDASKNERHLVRNISGQPLRRGIFTDEIYDIGRWENIHWNPWYSMRGKLWDWQQENGEAFILGKSDWHYIFDTFAYGYSIGYRFIDTGKGSTNGQMIGAAADGCNKAIQIDSASPIGLLITNGQFVSMFKDDRVMVEIKASNKNGTIMFQNCSFWGPADKNVVVESGDVTLQNCNFVNWDSKREGSPSIDVKAGNVIINSCRFQENKLPLEVGKDAKAVIFTSNIMKGTKTPIVDSKVVFEEGNNIYGVNTPTPFASP